MANLTKVPKSYDPVSFERIVQSLLKRIDEVEKKTLLKEARSLDNRSIDFLEEGRLYYRRDPNSVNLDLLMRLSGRLHRWSVTTLGAIGGETGGSAPANAPFVTTATSADLTNESVLTGTANQINVSGAILSTPQNIHTGSTPQFTRLGLGAAADGTASLKTGAGVIIGGEIDHNGSTVGLFGAAPTTQPTAITQTYSTADKTLGAYTPDDESGAYTGIDNLQAGTVYAQVSDLNALRIAYENLRVFAADGIQLLNAVIDDLQLLGLEQ